MTDCLDTDAIVTVGNAVRWDVASALRHLETCDDCGARLRALGATRAALLESEAASPATLAHISAAVRARSGARGAVGWPLALEAVLAGLTAPAVLVANGLPLREPGPLLLAVALGVVMGTAGGARRRGVAAGVTPE